MLRFPIVAAALLAALVLSGPTLAADAPLRGVALVIGESRYVQLPVLDNPRNDARGMDDLLDELGFEVRRVLDGDAAELRDEIADFVSDAADADVALVYYSGHGVELGGANYLIPVDADLATPQSAGASLVAVDDLLAELTRTVPVTIVLLDACRTNAFPAGQLIDLPGAGEAVAVGGPGLEAVRGPVPVAGPGVPADSLGVVIGFAASPGQPALDGEPGGNSPYGAALLKHFAAGGYALGDLMTLVSEEVYLKTKARQLPWVNSSLRRVLSFGTPVEAPDGDEAAIRDGRRALLMSIASAPETTRRYVEAVAQTENVPLDALYGMLKVLDIDATTPGGDLEAQLKAGADRLKALLATQTGAVRSDVELARLAGLADAAQDEGAIDVALTFRERASARAAELEAVVDANEANLREDRLQIGAAYAEHAATAALNFDFAGSVAMFRKAIAQVEDWDATRAAGYRNDLGVSLMAAGDFETDTASLEEAAEVLAASLDGFSRQSDPVNWARAQSNLGNVLQKLGDRKEDPSLYYRAAEAHEAALGVLTRETRPLDWATAEMNLGNALARIGEAGDAETLQAAIDAFRATLEVRTREAVPVEWAASQDNLGSALSSLARLTGDAELFDEGIAAFRAALEVNNRQTAPLVWASAQRNLGLALKTRGAMVGDVAGILAGADAYRAALLEFTRERTPMDFAQTSAILGFALMEAAKTAPTREMLEEARGRFADARSVYGPLSADDDAYFAGRIAEIDAALGG